MTELSSNSSSKLLEKPQRPTIIESSGDKPNTVLVGEKLRDLPIMGIVREFLESVKNNPITVLSAFTGAGKSGLTPILKMGGHKNILVLEPTRSLTRNYSKANEHLMPAQAMQRSESRETSFVHEGVEYEAHDYPDNRKDERVLTPDRQLGVEVRGEKDYHDDNYGRAVTDGMALNYISGDPLLSKFDVLVIDEYDRAGINIELFVSYARFLIDSGLRPDLKLVISSATLDLNKLDNFAGGIPNQTVELKEERPIKPESHFVKADSYKNKDVLNQLSKLVPLELAKVAIGDGMIVFLPSKKAVENLASALKSMNLEDVEIRVCHSDVDPALLNKNITEPAKKGKKVIYISTDILASGANPGLCISNAVIVPRVYREEFNKSSGLPSIAEEKTSKALASQMTGRIGRRPSKAKEGTEYNVTVLASEEQYDEFAEFPVSELEKISSSNLEHLILRTAQFLANTRQSLANNQLKTSKEVKVICDIRKFKLPVDIDPERLEEGIAKLKKLGYLTSQEKLTPKGSLMLELPTNLETTEMLLQTRAEKPEMFDSMCLVAPLIGNDDEFFVENRFYNSSPTDELSQNNIKSGGIEYAVSQLPQSIESLKSNLTEKQNELTESEKKIVKPEFKNNHRQETERLNRLIKEQAKQLSETESAMKFVSEFIKKSSNELIPPKSDLFLKYDLIRFFDPIPGDKREALCYLLGLSDRNIKQILEDYDKIQESFRKNKTFTQKIEPIKSLLTSQQLAENPEHSSYLNGILLEKCIDSIILYHKLARYSDSDKESVREDTIVPFKQLAVSTASTTVETNRRKKAVITYHSGLHPINPSDLLASKNPKIQVLPNKDNPYITDTEGTVNYKMDITYVPSGIPDKVSRSNKSILEHSIEIPKAEIAETIAKMFTSRSSSHKVDLRKYPNLEEIDQSIHILRKEYSDYQVRSGSYLQTKPNELIKGHVKSYLEKGLETLTINVDKLSLPILNDLINPENLPVKLNDFLSSESRLYIEQMYPLTLSIKGVNAKVRYSVDQINIEVSDTDVFKLTDEEVSRLFGYDQRKIVLSAVSAEGKCYRVEHPSFIKLQNTITTTQNLVQYREFMNYREKEVARIPVEFKSTEINSLPLLPEPIQYGADKQINTPLYFYPYFEPVILAHRRSETDDYSTMCCWTTDEQKANNSNKEFKNQFKNNSDQIEMQKLETHIEILPDNNNPPIISLISAPKTIKKNRTEIKLKPKEKNNELEIRAHKFSSEERKPKQIELLKRTIESETGEFFNEGLLNELKSYYFYVPSRYYDGEFYFEIPPNASMKADKQILIYLLDHTSITPQGSLPYIIDYSDSYEEIVLEKNGKKLVFVRDCMINDTKLPEGHES